ncbi:AAA family ATPase [Candidatus Woesearchaeota archaeon]|jgi:dTMP kinase|nr:AAA family ATPase [Candidatus Woesearchaeota archaeon]MBT5272383.1 AAA family ATPase [Candidatus Woesearchaeota archaeon]MBT6040994.1 AAA family ATPase [Candidatus Woesearchaeota archaeon]MBT6336655.1 AAA family ATPase [Candidatus Woesearchaeota archaeon]MBT7927545.1 AAA family ATPase [Candidatus Woesearchaeota archaeon]
MNQPATKTRDLIELRELGIYVPGVIVVEGLDGVGKSTAAKSLAERLNADYVASPTKEFAKLKDVFDNESAPLERFFFYLISNYSLSKQVMKRDNSKPLIIDRFVLSTITYHNALMNEDTSKYVRWDKLLNPEIMFHLVADEETRISRMNIRGELSRTDVIFEENRTLGRRIESEFESYRNAYIEIDTTRLNPQEVVDRMHKELKNRDYSCLIQR